MAAKSPFPGMDPYLEKHWGDVHTRLITYASDQLQGHLPSDLRARAQERVFVQDSSKADGQRMTYPDVHVVETRSRKGRRSSSSPTAVAEPLIVTLEAETITQRYLEIIDTSDGGRVVTVLEFLSPSNKVPGEGLQLYLRKQKDWKEGGVNLVEIDLLRHGRRVLLARPELLPASHRTLYQVCVWRSSSPLEAEVYAITLQQGLPSIRVPLREQDDDVVLDLQKLVARCYQQGRYDDIDYAQPLEPALGERDARWLRSLLKGRKKK